MMCRSCRCCCCCCCLWMHVVPRRPPPPAFEINRAMTACAHVKSDGWCPQGLFAGWLGVYVSPLLVSTAVHTSAPRDPHRVVGGGGALRAPGARAAKARHMVRLWRSRLGAARRSAASRSARPRSADASGTQSGSGSGASPAGVDTKRRCATLGVSVLRRRRLVGRDSNINRVDSLALL